MVVKRRKIGNTTVTINTKTGRQTTSRRSGNITYSQSNQGHNKTTQTFNFGNGFFERKTTNWNKKKRSKKSNWSWFSNSSSTSSKSYIKSTEKPIAIEKKEPFVGPPFPVFWKRKKFSQFTFFEWIGWLIVLPFRVITFMLFWGILLGLFVKGLQFIMSMI